MKEYIMRYSGRAAQPSSLQSWTTHPDPLEGVRFRLRTTPWTWSFWFGAAPGWGQVEEDFENRLAQAVQTPFLLPPPPEELLVRGRTGAEGGGNLFGGKQFQASAVCACTLLPTNLVLSVILPGKRMRSAARELDGLGVQGWVYPGFLRKMKPAEPPPSLCCKVTMSDQNLG